MNSTLFKSFLKRNSSTILTCVGAAGVISTSVLAVKATPKAIKLLEQANEEKGDKLTKFEIAYIVGPLYIPSIFIGISTIACIFGANALNKHQQASLMSLYAFADNSFKEYRRKVSELYNESEIAAGIAKDRYNKCNITSEDNQKLFFDYHSMQYFYSTMEEVLNAEINFNKKLSLNGQASLNDFYDALNLPRVDYGYELGWSADGWVDFDHETAVMDDGLECCIISMVQEPGFTFNGF